MHIVKVTKKKLSKVKWINKKAILKLKWILMLNKKRDINYVK